MRKPEMVSQTSMETQIKRDLNLHLGELAFNRIFIQQVPKLGTPDAEWL